MGGESESEANHSQFIVPSIEQSYKDSARKQERIMNPNDTPVGDPVTPFRKEGYESKMYAETSGACSRGLDTSYYDTNEGHRKGHMTIIQEADNTQEESHLHTRV
jgi:hypothetical protein